MSTDTLDTSEAAQAASIFTRPVVPFWPAKMALRPPAPKPARTISYGVLFAALAKAICLTKPRLADAVEAELAATVKRYEENRDELAEDARETLEWFRDAQEWGRLSRRYPGEG